MRIARLVLLILTALGGAAAAQGAAKAQPACPATRGIQPLFPGLGPHAVVLLEGSISEVAGLLTHSPDFVTSDHRGVLRMEVIRQYGPHQVLIRPRDGVPLGATVSLDMGFVKKTWQVKPPPTLPPRLVAVRRTHEQVPANAGPKPPWRRWSLQVDGDVRWVEIVGPGGGAGVFPVQPNGQVHLEWGHCMRARHSVPALPGTFKVRALSYAGAPVGPTATFVIPR